MSTIYELGPHIRAIPAQAPSPHPDQVVIAPIAVELSGGALGTVIAVGEACTEYLNQVVLVGSFDPCGECDTCRRGDMASCAAPGVWQRRERGMLADRLVANARWLLPLTHEFGPLATEPAVAALASEGLLAYSIYAMLNCSATSPVAVYGPASSLASWLHAILNAQGVPCTRDATASASLPAHVARVAWFEATPPPALPAGARGVWVTPYAAASESPDGWQQARAPHPDFATELVALVVKGALDLLSLVQVAALQIDAPTPSFDARSAVLALP